MTWEERWHPLREEWVVVAAHRQDRPWSGETVERKAPVLPTYSADCYFCPGNLRISGERNAEYASTFVFDNDHPCVGRDAPLGLDAPPGIYQNRPAGGVSRVVCYSPRHDLTLAQLEVPKIVELLSVWRDQYIELGARDEVRHVLTFENKGEVVGVSNPHPHCQIYATNFVFKTIEVEAAVSRKHREQTGKVLFQEILEAEQQDGRRIVVENDQALAFIPYFARYAYESYVSPRETHPSLASMTPVELNSLAAVLKELLVKMDNLWTMSFPYVLTLHQAPTDDIGHEAFHFHLEIHPPLRRPNLLKYLAGPEIGGGNFLSDTSPEDKAAELRAQSSVHYSESNSKQQS